MMHDELRQIRALYGEPVGPDEREGPEDVRRTAGDDLLPIKQLLDARPGRAPRRTTVDAVLSAARSASAPAAARDREPHRRTVPGRVWIASGAFVLSLVVGILWITSNRSPAPDRTPAVAENASPIDSAGPEVLASTQTPTLRSPEEPRMPGNVPPPEASAPDEQLTSYRRNAGDRVQPQLTDPDMDLAWDHSAEVEALFQRVEVLTRHTADDEWAVTPARRTLAAPVGLTRARYTPAGASF